MPWSITAIETAHVIEELIAHARDMKKAGERGEALGLNENETAFHDALEGVSIA